MPISDRLLLGPGPSNPYPEAVAALSRPMLGHMDPEFITIMDETMARLRTVFRTDNALTFPVSGTGSAGMETCFVNLVQAGDTVIVGVNGVFGERMCEVARRCGADVVLVDTVTSLGGIPVEIDGWNVDAAYSGTQKCLGVPPGLSPVTFSARAVERIRTRVLPPQSWYLDVSLIASYVDGASRVYHHTAPVSMVCSLHAALGALLDEGLEAAWARHRSVGTRLQAELPELGFRLVVPDGHRLPELTTAWLPEGADDATLRKALLTTYGIEVGGGLGKFAGGAWRIGLMGHSARDRSVTTLLDSLRELL